MTFPQESFFPNLKSGIVVALVSVPMAISLAIVCGATPLMGLLSWAWSGLFAAFFCSSRHNAYGPAGALAGILLPISLSFGLQYFPLLAILSGLFMLVFWLLRLTKYLSLIPWSALQWFLLGIWLIIGLQQVPAILWLNLEYDLITAIQHIGDSRWVTIVLFAISLGILQLCRKRFPKVPGIVIVTILWVVIGRFLAPAMGVELDLLMTQYGDVSFSLFQSLDWGEYLSSLKDMTIMKTMITASIGIAVIALLETLISAKIAMKQTRVTFNAQREVYGLWLTNILTGLVWWIPVSALVPRTSLNVQSGATSKLSGWLVGVCTAVFAAFLFTGALQYLPFAVIAGILIDIALGMFNLSLYHKLWKLEKMSIMIIVLVWVISYVWDPMLGILIGTVIALLMVVKRAMSWDLVANVFRDGHHLMKTPLSDYPSHAQEGDLLLIKLEGELNYLTVESHTAIMQDVTKASTIVLWFGYSSVLDHDAAEEFDVIINKWIKQGKKVYLTGLHGNNLRIMQHGSVYEILEKEGHVFESKTVLLDELLSS